MQISIARASMTWGFSLVLYRFALLAGSFLSRTAVLIANNPIQPKNENFYCISPENIYDRFYRLWLSVLRVLMFVSY